MEKEECSLPADGMVTAVDTWALRHGTRPAALRQDT